MELYLLRHGIAESRAISGRDADRRLTAGGAAELRLMLKRALGTGAQPEVILSSPYRRTLQTAEIASSVFSYAGEIVPASALMPESHPSAVWTEIGCFPEAKSILLVTHEPLVSELLSWLLGTSRVGAGFPPAGIARVDLEGPPPGRLKYMLTPGGIRGV